MPSVNGLPSVTEILAGVGLTSYYPSNGQETAMKRGQALHHAIALDAEGKLDEASVHPEIRPGLEAYRAFVKDTGHVALWSELELKHDTLGFVGHLDRVSKDGDLIDWKFSGSPDLVGARFQLAGYRMLWESHLFPFRQALVVALGKDGRYKVHDVTDSYAMQVFTAALVVYRARKENGR